MLVLSRAVHESIMIGDMIRFYLTCVDGRGVNVDLIGPIPAAGRYRLGVEDWIWITPHISARVLRLVSGKVRIGIAAPKSVKILRREIWTQTPAGKLAVAENHSA